MPRASIQCKNCGTRVETDLNELEIRTLKAQTNITRYCKRCAGTTRWVGHGADFAAPAPAAAAPGIGGGRRILLIDDDENVLKVLGKVLKGLEFELDTASNGREATAKLSRNDYDLIISDIRMPELDGKQLFQFLELSLPEYKQRVIFLTGDTGNEETMNFLHESNCPYLTKPLEIPTLLNLLHQFFTAE